MKANRRAFAAGATAVLLCTVVPAMPGGSAAGATRTAPASARDRAAAALVSHPGVFRAGAHDAFTPRGKVLTDPDGATHARFDRTYRGLPVLGGDVVVHLAPDGSLAGGTLTLDRAVDVRTTAEVGRAAAVRTARDELHGRVDSTSSRLVVDATRTRPALAWEVTVTGVRADRTPAELHVVVDAASGAVRWSADEVETGAGYGIHSGQVPLGTSYSGGTYRMIDPTRGGNTTGDHPSGQPTFTSSVDVWGDYTMADRASAGVDAHYGAQVTWDFYRNVLGRAGIWGDGSGIPSWVHVGDGYDNAYYYDGSVYYGDGEDNLRSWASIDVAGHEITHAVTEDTADLIYSGESGGLNEATSDIFGTAVEFYANDPNDPGDYLPADSIDAYGNGTPLRYMDRPSRDGQSVDCVGWYTGDLDPHYSSGPANHAFYLMAEGSGTKTIGGVPYDSPTCDGSTVTGIGRAAAVQIWYRALTVYMVSGTDYVGARAAAVHAAKDLYGTTSPECATVEAAFSAIWVNGTTCWESSQLTASLSCGSAAGYFACNVDIEGGIPPYTTGWAGAGVDWQTTDTGYAEGYCTPGSMPRVGTDVRDSAGGVIWLEQQFDCP